MSDVTDTLSKIAGAATSGPVAGVGVVMEAINGIIGKFVTDPNAKLEATQHALELQAQLQIAQLDAMTKQTQSANEAAKNDHYLWGARAFFCYSFSALYIFIYSGLEEKILHVKAPEIPMNLNFIFAGVMLGCIGIPAAIEAMKQIMSMPGDSSVKVPGFAASNKS